MAVYTESKEEKEKEKETTLPDLTAGQKLKLYKLVSQQHFTEPPSRFSEASLVKTLEEKGIGRPSTYAPITETILARGYVVRTEKRFEPTELGFVVVDLLKQYFQSIVDVEFTAGMEDQLDEIAEGQGSHIQLLKEFYEPFAKTLAHAEEEIGDAEIPVEVSDVPCEKCGRLMVVKHGRYGKFLACPGFPDCRNTKPILKDTGVKCPKCDGTIVERRTKRGKVFYGCKNYPECDFVTWDMPLQEDCKTCGSFMTRHNFKNGRFVTICSNEACPTRQADLEKKTSKAKAGSKGTKKTATKKTGTKKTKTKQSANRRKTSV
jgi:DNA topoisomerase-1